MGTWAVALNREPGTTWNAHDTVGRRWIVRVHLAAFYDDKFWVFSPAFWAHNPSSAIWQYDGLQPPVALPDLSTHESLGQGRLRPTPLSLLNNGLGAGSRRAIVDTNPGFQDSPAITDRPRRTPSCPSTRSDSPGRCWFRGRRRSAGRRRPAPSGRSPG